MRRAGLTSLALVLAAACGGSGSRKLVLLHTNDEHSHVLGFSPEVDDFPPSQTAGSGTIHGGMARRATVFTSERARAKSLGADTLTVSAGDNMMGTLLQIASTTGAPDFRMMKILGYDVTTLGNHEFDFGPAGLAAAISVAMANEGMVPTVASNIHFPGAGADSLAALFDETGTDITKPIHRTLVVKTAGGLKVGFVGIVGVDASFKAPAKAPVQFSKAFCCGEDNPIATLSQLFDDLRPLVNSLHKDSKVDLVVLLSHGGVDLVTPERGEDFQIAKNVPGIDVIVSGHTHSVFPATVVTNDQTQRPVLIQQAGAYGAYVGRIQLTVDGNGNVTFDDGQSTLVPVDDTTVGGDPRIDTFVTGTIAALESTPVVTVGGHPLSFLEYTLTSSTGHLVQNNASQPGNLYFYPLGKTAFDIPAPTVYKESQTSILAADAELFASEVMGQQKADVTVVANGAIRGGILKGKTGTVDFADLFSVVSIGGSPVTNTPGYPLCRYALALAEIKGAFDLVGAGLAQQSVSNSDFFLVPAGMKVEFDLTRPAFDPSKDPLDPTNGRVTRISIAHDHTGGVYETYDQVIYDASHKDGSGNPDPFFGGTGAALTPYTVVTNLYVATLSYVGGVKLKNPATGAVYSSPAASIMHRPNGSEIKDWEALAGFVAAQAAANGGTMPARYNPAVSTQQRRAVCLAGCR
jgi:5'-nucleotidase/UDP-sugar diphosphatase